MDLHVYPAPYNTAALKGEDIGLQGDFMVGKTPRYGTLEDIRRGFPAHTLKVHFGSKVLEHAPPNQTIVRMSPTEEQLEARRQEGIRHAQSQVPWRQIGVRAGDPSFWKLPRAHMVTRLAYLDWLHREHDKVFDRIATMATESHKTPFDPYTSLSWDERIAYEEGQLEVLKEQIVTTSVMSDEEFQIHSYTQTLLRNMSYKASFGQVANDFDNEIVDRLEGGEPPALIWLWFTSLFERGLPKSKRKAGLEFFAMQISQRATDHAAATAYKAVAAGADPDQIRSAILADWSVVPKFSEYLQKRLDSAAGFWVVSTMHDIADRIVGKPPTRAKLAELIDYVDEVIAPAFARLSKVAGDEARRYVLEYTEDVARIYRI